MKILGKMFYREKKYYCGNYLEVNVYPVMDIKQQGKKEKKKESALPQKRLNDKNAYKKLLRLVYTNFTDNDFHITATYQDKFLPKTEEETEKKLRNYIVRLRRYARKHNLPEIKYISVTESGMDSNGTIKRVHHHILFSCPGMSRDEIENLWHIKGEPIGYCNVDRLQIEVQGAEALCKYLTKMRNKNNKKLFRPSHNLKKPIIRKNDFSYSRSRVQKIIRENDCGYFEKRCSGYTVKKYQAEYTDFLGWSIHVALKKLLI